MGKYSDSEIEEEQEEEEEFLEEEQEQEEDELIDDCHFSRSSQEMEED